VYLSLRWFTEKKNHGIFATVQIYIAFLAPWEKCSKESNNRNLGKTARKETSWKQWLSRLREDEKVKEAQAPPPL
jgi:hypothetical protein